MNDSLASRLLQLILILVRVSMVSFRGLIQPEKFTSDTLFIVHLHYRWPGFAMNRLMRRLEDKSQILVTSSNPLILEQAIRNGVWSLEVENLGRNFGALLGVPARFMEKAQIVVHLHGKETRENRAFGRVWNYLLWGLLASPETLRKARHISAGAPIIFFPDISPVFRQSSLSWGRSKRFMSLLPANVQNLLDRYEKIIFPIGGMFACTPKFLCELKDFVSATSFSFSREPISNDGEWPHFLERAVAILASASGNKVICWRQGTVLEVKID